MDIYGGVRGELVENSQQRSAPDFSYVNDDDDDDLTYPMGLWAFFAHFSRTVKACFHFSLSLSLLIKITFPALYLECARDFFKISDCDRFSAAQPIIIIISLSWIAPKLHHSFCIHNDDDDDDGGNAAPRDALSRTGTCVCMHLCQKRVSDREHAKKHAKKMKIISNKSN